MTTIPLWTDEFTQVIYLFLAFISIFCVAETWHRQLSPPAEFTRKFIHISSGILISCFPWIVHSKLSVALLGICVGSVLAICRKLHLLKSLHEVKRQSLGVLHIRYSPTAALGSTILFIR